MQAFEMPASMRRFAMLSAVALLLSIMGLAPAAQADEHVERIFGDNRFGTAASIATATFEGQTTTDVIVTAGFRFPDSLAANGLAGLLDAPILLVNEVRDEAMQSTLDALEELAPDTLHIVGGTSAVSEAVAAELDAAGDWDLERFSGEDRYHTAALMVEEFAEVDTVLVATGEVAADSLAAGPLAYHAGYPLLLTRSTSLSDATADALEGLDLDDVLVLGGESAVSEDVVSEIEALTGTDAERLSGANRAGTAVEIAEYALAHYGEHFDAAEFAIATGWGSTRHSPHNAPVPADALSGGPYGGVHGTAILPINDVLDSVPDETCDFLGEHAAQIELMTIFGGTSAVSTDVEDTLVDCAEHEPDDETAYSTNFGAYDTGSAYDQGWTPRYSTNQSHTIEERSDAYGGQVLVETVTASEQKMVSWDVLDTDPDRADVDAVTRFRVVDAGSDWNGGIMIRGSGDAGSEFHYAAQLRDDAATGARLYRLEDGTFAEIEDGSFTFPAAETWVYMRYRHFGTSAKVQLTLDPEDLELDGDGEPVGGWTIETTTVDDEDFEDAGWIGFGTYRTSVREYDYLSVGTGGAYAELPSDWSSNEPVDPDQS